MHIVNTSSIHGSEKRDRKEKNSSFLQYKGHITRGKKKQKNCPSDIKKIY